MARKNTNGNDRARQVLAQEAARIIVEQGIDDFRVAKTKAATRLGLSTSGSLPGNNEIEAAVSRHLSLFGRELHVDLLHSMRRTALSAMEILLPFSPRLVGPVLQGTAIPNSPVNLHVFADAPELIALRLDEYQLGYKPFERRLKSRRDQIDTYAAFRFPHENLTVEATVFPVDGVRQAPISPINGKPMQRANQSAVEKLLAN